MSQCLPTAEIRNTCWSSQVYEPSDDSFLLVDALQLHAKEWTDSRPKMVLEIGSGSGFVICSMACMLKSLGIAAHLTAVDINPAAAAATRQTLDNHQVQGVEVVVTDLLGGLDRQLMGGIDILLFNPPYVPTPDEEVKQSGISRAWAGGYRGRQVIDRVLLQLPDILSPKGEMFMVTVAENDPAGIMREMQQRGFTGSIVLSRQADEETLSIIRLARSEKAP